MFNRNDTIEELERLLYEARVNVAALEKTLQLIGGTAPQRKEKPPDPPAITAPPAKAKTPSARKFKSGEMTATVKAAMKIAPTEFTVADVRGALPHVSEAVADHVAGNDRLSAMVSYLFKDGYLTRLRKKVGNGAAVYRIKDDEQPIPVPTKNTQKSTAKETTDKAPADHKPRNKEKAEAIAALNKDGPVGYMCEDCGETFEKCPQFCPKCNSGSFEGLG
ncbi:hypothetical protein LCGC14_1842860 [marine sediment metagenome]|uniref:Uncharacterized protein n=1 Tax=marine sediment metagenome TaxID=412755 RepID=A0A0F9H0X3_9ZZZZ